MANTDLEDELLGEEEEVEEGRRSIRAVPALVLTLAVAGFVSLAWYAYHSGNANVKEDDVLLIEADKSPLKEKPEDPGGMKFPHQDKTIFNEIASNPPKAGTVERVLPGAEEPMEISASEGKPASETPAVSEAQPKTETLVEAPAAEKPVVAEAPKPEPVKSEPVMVREVPVKTVATPVKTPAPVKVEPKASAEAKKPAETVKPAASASGAGVIQLGAYKSEEEAKGDWAKISKKFSSQLAGKTPSYVRADLGAKGVFYRLRVSGIADTKSTCAALSAQKQACIPVSGK